MILRYAHANGASLFFIVVYIHILRGVYYSSGNQPREAVWITGVIILLVMVKVCKHRANMGDFHHESLAHILHTFANCVPTHHFHHESPVKEHARTIPTSSLINLSFLFLCWPSYAIINKGWISC
jgi:hypothetical protein